MNLETVRRRIAEISCRLKLSRTPAWKPLQEYLVRTKSTGCSYIDYWHLWDAVIKHRPQEVLELGTGASTVVLAHAVLANGSGRITSMEESAQWYAHAKENIPPGLPVEILLSDTIEDCFEIFRGVRYRDVPSRPYDFVFVDGPKYTTADGDVSFDFDLISVIRDSDAPVRAIIDKRVSTTFVLQRILPGKVRYVPHLGLGFVNACTRNDVRRIDRKSPSSSFALAGTVDFRL